MLLSAVREFGIQMWPKQGLIGLKFLQWYAWVMWLNPEDLQLYNDNPVWLSHCPDSERVMHEIIVTIELSRAKLS